MKTETYKSARVRLLAELASLGWQVSPDLKIPHARNPAGTVALFFRPQAVYCAPIAGNATAASVASEAHSLWFETRSARVGDLISDACRYCCDLLGY